MVRFAKCFKLSWMVNGDTIWYPCEKKKIIQQNILQVWSICSLSLCALQRRQSCKSFDDNWLHKQCKNYIRSLLAEERQGNRTEKNREVRWKPMPLWIDTVSKILSLEINCAANALQEQRQNAIHLCDEMTMCRAMEIPIKMNSITIGNEYDFQRISFSILLLLLFFLFLFSVLCSFLYSLSEFSSRNVQHSVCAELRTLFLSETKYIYLLIELIVYL